MSSVINFVIMDVSKVITYLFFFIFFFSRWEIDRAATEKLALTFVMLGSKLKYIGGKI